MMFDSIVIPASSPDSCLAHVALCQANLSTSTSLLNPAVHRLSMNHMVAVSKLSKPSIRFILWSKEDLSDLLTMTDPALSRALIPTQPNAGVATWQEQLAGLRAQLASTGLAAES